MAGQTHGLQVRVLCSLYQAVETLHAAQVTRVLCLSLSTITQLVKHENIKIVACLLNVLATCKCISGSDQLRQFYVLPHWDISCRSNFPSHPATVYWHQANQSQHWPRRQTPGRVATGVPMFKSLVWLDPEKSRHKQESNEHENTTQEAKWGGHEENPLNTGACWLVSWSLENSNM